MASLGRTCTACGTRNNPKWEFCVRCGEPLETTESVELEAESAEPAPEPVGFPWRSVLTVAGAVALVATVFAVEPAEKPVGRFIQLPVPVAERPQLPPPVPPDRTAKLRDGQGWLTQGKPQKALEPLRAALQENGGDPQAHFAYGRALWESGSREEALGAFEVAARLGGGRYRTEYGNVLLQTGRTAEGREVLERAVADKPDDLKALEILGQLHNREGRVTEAVAVLSQAAALKPDDPLLQAHLGYALERTGNSKQAAEVLSSLVTRVPESIVVRELLAEAQFKEGKQDEAITVVREGLQRWPDSSDLHRRLGSLLERAGRGAEAASAYREYLRLAPSASDAEELAQRAARLERAGSSQS